MCYVFGAALINRLYITDWCTRAMKATRSCRKNNHTEYKTAMNRVSATYSGGGSGGDWVIIFLPLSLPRLTSNNVSAFIDGKLRSLSLLVNISWVLTTSAHILCNSSLQMQELNLVRLLLCFRLCLAVGREDAVKMRVEDIPPSSCINYLDDIIKSCP